MEFFNNKQGGQAVIACCQRPARSSSLRRFLILWVAWAGLASSQAVLFYSTGDPSYNTSAPSDLLTNSGWQYEGIWNDFLGTAIAPRYFITAKHVGGIVGNSLILNGSAYVTTDYFDHPQNDLRIWRVRDPLPVAAPLYPRTDEAGRSLVVIGRGTQRGDPLNFTSRFGHPLKGWLWGAGDGLRRWGENRVASIFQDQALNAEFLKMTFDANAGANESALSGGDSGGAVFIQDGTEWKLAGINYAVDGPFNTNAAGAGFYAAIFDAGGIYEGGEGNWTFNPESPMRQPRGFYATRISSSLDWIQQILAQPIPDDVPGLASSYSLSGPFSPEISASIDPISQSIRIAAPSTTRFFKLTGTPQRRILSVIKEGGELVLSY
jgi:hypothetical protein